MRVFSGVVLGYLTFALLSFAMFRVTNHDPHSPASISFEVGSTVAGFLFAVLGGFVASFIAGRPHILAARIVALLVAVGAILSIIAKGISWSPMIALILLAPSVLLGGLYYRWQVERRGKKE